MENHLSSQGLAKLVKELRGDLSQESLAQRFRVSKQAISQAENQEVGTKINKLRIEIIENLSSYEVEGPFWSLNLKESSE
ncbi:MAG: hypothetical protein HC799_18940 [Limnothrix sp. RL_2_0]|nr:hypothetical protein [Limnothrix sp. RL_2_0]